MSPKTQLQAVIQSKSKFVHFHVHTIYSVLDSIIRIPDLVSRVKELGQEAVAITDHGVLHGVIDFYKECKKQGVKPLIGCEIYMTHDADGLSNEEKTKDNFHLLLIAKNNQGFKDLLRLVSNANSRNFYYKPRVSLQQLKKYGPENFVCTSSCLGGPVSKSMIWDKETETVHISDITEKSIKQLHKIFKDNFYLEIQDHDNWEQRAYNHLLVSLARSYKIPLIITTDAHYLTAKDADAHKIAMAQQLKMTVENYEKKGSMIYKGDFWIRSTEDMREAALKYEALDAFENTGKIASECNVDIEFGVYHMPTFDITEQEDYEDFLNSEFNND